MGKFLFHLYNHRRIILIILFAVSLAWFASAYANILILRTRTTCAEETCSGSCEFACSWEDGTDELNTNGTHVWDGEAGSSALAETGAGSSFDGASCDSITVTTAGDYLYEDGFNDNTAYLRAQIKPTATTTQFDADYEYQSVFGLRDSGGTNNVAYLQIYRQADDTIVFRCRANDSGTSEDCGSATTAYEFTSGDIYEIEIYVINGGADESREAGWRGWHWNGSSWDQVIGSGGAFDTNTGCDVDITTDEIYAGEYYSGATNPSFSLELDNIFYSTAAIGQSGRNP